MPAASLRLRLLPAMLLLLLLLLELLLAVLLAALLVTLKLLLCVSRPWKLPALLRCVLALCGAVAALAAGVPYGAK